MKLNKPDCPGRRDTLLTRMHVCRITPFFAFRLLIQLSPPCPCKQCTAVCRIAENLHLSCCVGFISIRARCVSQADKTLLYCYGFFLSAYMQTESELPLCSYCDSTAITCHCSALATPWRPSSHERSRKGGRRWNPYFLWGLFMVFVDL